MLQRSSGRAPTCILRDCRHNRDWNGRYASPSPGYEIRWTTGC